MSVPPPAPPAGRTVHIGARAARAQRLQRRSSRRAREARDERSGRLGDGLRLGEDLWCVVSSGLQPERPCIVGVRVGRGNVVRGTGVMPGDGSAFDARSQIGQARSMDAFRVATQLLCRRLEKTPGIGLQLEQRTAAAGRICAVVDSFVRHVRKFARSVVSVKQPRANPPVVELPGLRSRGMGVLAALGGAGHRTARQRQGGGKKQGRHDRAHEPRC